MPETTEKRRCDRFQFRGKIQIYPVLASESGNIYEVQNNSFAGRTLDISEGGLRLESAKDIPDAPLLKLAFEVIKDQPVEVYGKVVWSGQGHLGVCFVLPDSAFRKDIQSINRGKNPGSR